MLALVRRNLSIRYTPYPWRFVVCWLTTSYNNTSQNPLPLARHGRHRHSIRNLLYIVVLTLFDHLAKMIFNFPVHSDISQFAIWQHYSPCTPRTLLLHSKQLEKLLGQITVAEEIKMKFCVFFRRQERHADIVVPLFVFSTSFSFPFVIFELENSGASTNETRRIFCFSICSLNAIRIIVWWMEERVREKSVEIRTYYVMSYRIVWR